MKTRILLLCWPFFGLFMAYSYSQKKVLEGSDQGINKVFDHYIRYTNTLNTEGIASCISDRGDFRWLEDGALQYNSKEALIQDLGTFLPRVASIHFNISKRDIRPLGCGLASLFAEYTKEISLKSGEEFRFKGVMSILMVEENGSWKFLQGHSSHIPPNLPLQKLQEGLQGVLDSIAAQDNVPGITFSLLLKDKRPINLASGLANIEDNIPMHPHAPMPSGSIGKMFVSAFALKMAQENQLRLSDRVWDYLGTEPWYQGFPNAREIRIINLLNHTSGLPDYLYLPDFMEDFKKDFRVPRSHTYGISFVSGQPAEHPVGKGWHYSDTNYILLGLILEQINARDLFTTIENEFIQPLNLERTRPADTILLEGLPQGYLGGYNPFGLPSETVIDPEGKLVINPAIEWAAGGLVSNPADLAKFISFLQESDYLDEERKAVFRTPVNTKTGERDSQGYGMGAVVFKKGEDVRLGHSGYFPGYLSQVEYSLENQFALSIQINANMENGIQLLRTYTDRLENILMQFQSKNNSR